MRRIDETQFLKCFSEPQVLGYSSIEQMSVRQKSNFGQILFKQEKLDIYD